MEGTGTRSGVSASKFVGVELQRRGKHSCSAIRILYAHSSTFATWHSASLGSIVTRKAEIDGPPGERSRSHRRTVMLWLGAGIAVAATAVSFGARSDDARDVPVAVVARKDVSAWISSNGKVEPSDPEVVVARVDTFIRDVFVTEGAAVSVGQRLLTLDATELRAALARTREEYLAAQEQMQSAKNGGRESELARAEGDLARTDARLTKLRTDRDSLQRLVDNRAATRDELAEVTVALQQAESERAFLARKEASVRQRATSDAERAVFLAQRARQTILALEDQLRSTDVVATRAGTVYHLPVRSGQYVRIGDTLAEIADLHAVRVRAFIDEPELGSIAAGQDVVIAWDALTGRSWTGRTEQMPTSVVPRGGRSVGEVLCSVDNADMKLLPNVNVDVRVRTAVRSQALTVPRSAVHAAADTRYVFVVRDGRLRQQPITVGVASTSEYEVMKGLSEGEVVAVGSDSERHDGMAVRIAR
jgi:HlyD family secretion protein